MGPKKVRENMFWRRHQTYLEKQQNKISVMKGKLRSSRYGNQKAEWSTVIVYYTVVARNLLAHFPVPVSRISFTINTHIYIQQRGGFSRRLHYIEWFLKSLLGVLNSIPIVFSLCCSVFTNLLRFVTYLLIIVTFSIKHGGKIFSFFSSLLLSVWNVQWPSSVYLTSKK